MALFLKRNTRSKFGLSIWQSCANTLRMLPEHSLPMVTPPWPSFMMQFCTMRFSLGACHIGRRLAAMAGVATDVDLAVRELRVDVVDHFHHAARHQLLGVLVAGIVALNVAEIAPLTESAAHRTHHGTFVLSLEDFQVLGRAAASPTLLGSSILSTDGHGREKKHCG